MEKMKEKDTNCFNAPELKSVEYVFEIEGIAPIKFDRYLDLPQPGDKEGWKVQAAQKVWRNENGFLVLPNACLKACLREASSELGPRTGSGKRRRDVRALVFISPAYLSFEIKNYDGIAEDAVKRGQGKKLTTVVTYRPFLKEGWKLKGKLISYGPGEDFLKACFKMAGFKYGLCGHRPEFGRFELIKFERL